MAATLVAGAVGASFLSGSAPLYAQAPYPGLWSPLSWFFLIPLFFLLFFGLRLFLWGGWCPGGWVDPAIETLRERFASGEITRDQYEQVRRDLEGREA